MKLKTFLTTLILSILCNISLVSANTLYSLDIDVTLDTEGNGKITEIWDMNVNQGTEVYKPMTHLGNSEITNFKVVDESGNIYTYVDNWDVDGTLSTKKYKNGFHNISDGLELCWGMSSYGKHTYTISYNVSNMIYNVSDAQVLYWKLVNDSMNPAPHKINITISGPDYYSDTLDVWGYGYKGYAYVYDGIIYMSNEENTRFRTSDYAVILVKYPSETFRTDNKIDEYNTFDDFYNTAQKGTFKYDYSAHQNTFDIIFGLMGSFIIFFILFFFMVILFSKNSKKNNYIKKSLDKKNIPNFRDIPCHKELFDAYFISYIYNISKKKEDLMGAVLLKWLKDGKIKIIKSEDSKIFGGSKQVTTIDLTNNSDFDNILEKELFDMMYQASKDGLLQEKELNKWCSSNYSKFFKWFDKVETEVRKKYLLNGDIEEITKGKVFKSKYYIVNDKIHDEAVKLYGLKTYLKEFSRIKEKEPIEVMLWEDYLIFAQIFGIAKEVAKQFEKLYPELMNNNEYYINYYDILWINRISTNSANYASSAKSRAESYSSGGGGFSSGGGGGGSFGGGSGGGCR